MAGILDTFLVLFESDASKLDKGLADSKKKSDELSKSVAETDSGAASLGSQFVKMAGAAAAALGAVASIGFVIRGAMEQAEITDATGKMADSIGASVNDVAAWGEAVARSGGTAEGFNGTMRALSASLAQIETTGTGRALPFLKELGIDMQSAANKGKSAMDLLPQIADSFEGMSKSKSLGIAQKLGFDQGTITLLQSGRKAVEDLVARQKMLTSVTDDDVKSAEEFNDQLDDFHRLSQGVWTAVGTTILPALTSMLKVFERAFLFLREHKDVVTGVFIAIGSAISYFAIPPLLTMAGAVLAATWPFILMGAAVAAVVAVFALLYEDIMMFIDGNDSLIGDILEKYPKIGQVIGSVVDYFKDLWDIAVLVFDVMAKGAKLVFTGWQLIGGIVSDAVSEFMAGSGLIQDAIRLIQSAFESMGEGIGAVWDWIMAKIESAIALFSKVAGFVKGLLGDASAGLDSANSAASGLLAGKDHIAAAGMSGFGATTSNSISNGGARNSSVKVDKIEIKTNATDAEGISKAIGGSLQNHMRQATNGMDDGVRG